MARLGKGDHGTVTPVSQLLPSHATAAAKSVHLFCARVHVRAYDTACHVKMSKACIVTVDPGGVDSPLLCSNAPNSTRSRRRFP